MSFLINKHCRLSDRPFHGLCACDCGPDITKLLDDVLERIRGNFRTAISDDSKREACTLMITPPYAFAAWDIPELFDEGRKRGDPGDSCRSCVGTVTFKGKCYHAGQVNYAMWGAMMKLCGDFTGDPVFSQPMALKAVDYRKDKEDPPAPAIFREEAKGFAQYGYDGTLPQTPAFKDCQPNPKRFSRSNFDWVWEPFKPRVPGKPLTLPKAK